MKAYFKTKHEKDSARITTLIAVILILLIFIVGPKYLDPPLEYGVAVNFGTTDFGSGNVQPKEPIKSEQKAEIPPQKVEESKPVPSQPKETKEDVLTSDQIESIAIKKKEAEEAKKKAEVDAKAKKEADRIEKERNEQEAKKKRLDDLIGGIGKSDGTDSGSEGDDNKAGDEGNPLGDPYAPSKFGEPGSGGGRNGYGLGNRGLISKNPVKQKCNEEGRVVVAIKVDRNGNVIKAEAGVKGTTNNAQCLLIPAKETAMSYKWTGDTKAPNEQTGFVVINFSVTQ